MPRTVYLVWFYECGFVIDACAGGAYTFDVVNQRPDWNEEEALEFPTPEAAKAAMDAAELGKLGVDYEIVETTKPNL